MGRGLILNVSYEPLMVKRDRDTVVDYLEGKLEVVEYSDRVFRSPSISVMVPSVARITREYVDMPSAHRSVFLTPRAVLARDGFECGYCGRQNLTPGQHGNGTMDHIMPRSKGGPHKWVNVTASCRPCNSLKKDRTLDEMVAMGPDKPNVPGAVAAWTERWTLHRKPWVPTGVLAYMLTTKPEPAWLPYLGVAA